MEALWHRLVGPKVPYAFAEVVVASAGTIVGAGVYGALGESQEALGPWAVVTVALGGGVLLCVAYSTSTLMRIMPGQTLGALLADAWPNRLFISTVYSLATFLELAFGTAAVALFFANFTGHFTWLTSLLASLNLAAELVASLGLLLFVTVMSRYPSLSQWFRAIATMIELLGVGLFIAVAAAAFFGLAPGVGSPATAVLTNTTAPGILSAASWTNVSE